jgi:hypothetical protein
MVAVVGQAQAAGLSKLEISVNTFINGMNCIVAQFIQTSDSGEFYTGEFYLFKEDKTLVKARECKTLVKVRYLTGINQEILIRGGCVYIINNVEHKIYRHPANRVPVYSVLCEGFDLSREVYEVQKNSQEELRIRISKSGSGAITLVFSKYPSGDIKNLVAWIADDGNCKMLFSFDVKSMSINDRSKIPIGTFELSDAPLSN